MLWCLSFSADTLPDVSYSMFMAWECVRVEAGTAVTFIYICCAEDPINVGVCESGKC